jgi:hypothetical protein
MDEKCPKCNDIIEGGFCKCAIEMIKRDLEFMNFYKDYYGGYDESRKVKKEKKREENILMGTNSTKNLEENILMGTNSTKNLDFFTKKSDKYRRK